MSLFSPAPPTSPARPPRRKTFSGVRRRDTGEPLMSLADVTLPPVRRKSDTLPGSPGPGFVGTSIDLPALEWSSSRRLAFFRATCALVTAIHAEGTAHGQLWPGAILLTDQLEPHVDRQPPATESAERKPAYFAPEAREGAATISSDVFGLGRLLWFLATDGAEIEPNATRLAAQTAGIASVARRACALDPDSRHATVAALLAHLEEELATGADLDSAPTPMPVAAPRRKQRPQPQARSRTRPLVLGLAAVVAVAAAVFAWSSLSIDRGASREHTTSSVAAP